MPHIWVEYTANIEQDLNVPELLKCVQDALVGDGSLFPLAAARTRGIRIDDYYITDGNPDSAFVYIMIRIAAGRRPEDRKAAGDRVFEVVSERLAGLMSRRPLGITVQMQESDSTVNLKLSNYRDHVGG